jgi:hypothetical protein
MEMTRVRMRTIAMTQYDKKNASTGFSDRTQTYLHKKQESPRISYQQGQS